jgi:1-acyl-sn-glycerol-3-phosphate acyltransferase
VGSLGRKLNQAWRVFATGLCFSCFGLGALLQGLTIWPALAFSASDRRVGQRRVRRCISASMRAFVWLMHRVGGLTYEVHGLERLRQPGQLVIANHPTLIDVVFMISFMPDVLCIVKEQLWRNPFLRWPVSLAGYVSNAAGEELVGRCAQALREGQSLMIFPEGTRTSPGQKHTLQRGTAQIALAARCGALPVLITCTPITLFKGNPWFRSPQSRPHWTISVEPPLDLMAQVDPAKPHSVAARQLTHYLEVWFDEQVARQMTGRSPQHGETAN